MKGLADIYFYNARALAKELREGSVSEARAVKHLIAALILGGVGFKIPVSIDFQPIGSWGSHFVTYIALFIIAGVIRYYGVWLSYQVNGKGDGMHFFLRFAVLTLPIGVQLVILFFGVGLLLAVLAMTLTSAMGALGIDITKAAINLASIAFIAMFFLRMRRYIGLASGYGG